MKTWNFPRRLEQRREEALERQEDWDTLSVEEKIERLTDRGYGESKEAERLRKKL